MPRSRDLVPLPLPLHLLVSLLLSLAFTGCQPGDQADPAADSSEAPEATEPMGEPTLQDQWWANLSAPCGQAFRGRLGHAPPNDGMLEGDELLVVHFDVCEDDEIRLPFHIEQMDGDWDRSRTWIFRRTDNGRIELRHDHRQPDGSEDETTWYGAWTLGAGSANEQYFILEDRTAPDGAPLGWRVIIEPGVRYTYGTIRGDEWSWRVDFDLSEPMAELPPPAWGYEDGGGPLR